MQASNSQNAETDLLNKLHALMQVNPAVLKEVMHRYNPQGDAQTNRIVKFALMGFPGAGPEVAAFVMQMASSDDPIRRKDGFELLQVRAMEQSPEVRDFAISTLQTEQDPAIVSLAAGILRYATIEPTQAETIKAQLYSLTQHRDATVRAQSVQTLALLDKTGAAENSLYQALSDQASEVRQAAIQAIGESGRHSERLKAGLLNILGSEQAPGTKLSALTVLEGLPLNQTEYATYTKARAEVSTLPNLEGGTNWGLKR
jgi:hypothetical protein